MLVKFTITGGLIPVTTQAREPELHRFLTDLHRFAPLAEGEARRAARNYMDTHTQFTAGWIACVQDREWRPEFEPLYFAIERAVADRQRASQIAYEQASKFLGLLIWNEALRHPAEWHFTKYPKRGLIEEDPDSFTAEDYWVCHYFAVDAHIRANAKLRQAENFRRHGDTDRALDLENAARLLQERFRRTE
jgi:hypothetical protein